jgi:hypothetical protein
MTTSWRVRALKKVLRDALKEARVSGREAARRLNVPTMRVSRWLDDTEAAPSTEDVARLITAVGVTGDDFDRILRVANVGEDWFTGVTASTFIACERDAFRITECAPLVIPGLLQTPEYTRHLNYGGQSDAATEQAVAVRRERAAVLAGEHPTELLALIGIPALEGMIGGPKVMAEQLAHLASMARRSNVTVQAIDLGGGWTPAHVTSFFVYEYAELPTTVYVEQLSGGTFHVDSPHVDNYEAAVDWLRSVAMSPADTLELIASIIPEKEDM